MFWGLLIGFHMNGQFTGSRSS